MARAQTSRTGREVLELLLISTKTGMGGSSLSMVCCPLGGLLSAFPCQGGEITYVLYKM